MNKNRLEAFSDGVFAIAITLLILDIRIPSVDYNHLLSALRSIIPSIAAYILSFLIIGVYWSFHHFYIDLIKKINGTILVLNILGLLLVSFMPFPTSLMGRYPFTTIPVLIYGICLVGTNIIGFLTVFYLHKNPHLANEKFTPELYKRQLPIYFWTNGSYIIALFLAFRFPIISCIIFVVVLIGVSLNFWSRLNLIARK